MAYVTLQELEDRFGTEEILALTDRDGDGTPDSAVVDRAVADAGAEVDSYLEPRYTVPLADPVPEMVRRVAADITRYRLYDNAPSDEVRTRYEDAVAWLKRVSEGKASIGVEMPGGAGSTVAVVAPEPVFTEALLSRMPG